MELLTALPQLQTLNGVDRQGRRALPSDMVNDVPGMSPNKPRVSWSVFSL